MLELLQEVLNEAHSSHVYIMDQSQYGVVEHWTPSLQGDCEDFSLWIREKLKEHSLNPNLVYCKTETGEGHIVIEVDGWILDNRQQWVVTKSDLDYEWISLGTPEGAWYEIKE